jgi:predicted nucleic acid-binding protein
MPALLFRIRKGREFSRIAVAHRPWFAYRQMIVATCLEGGLTRLYSEDFDAYRQIEGLELINPFKISP